MNLIKKLIHNIKYPWREVSYNDFPKWANRSIERRRSPMTPGLKKRIAKGKHNLYMVKFTAHVPNGFRKYYIKSRGKK